MVISQDNDREVVPLVFALVEEKCQGAYEWFLKNLKRHMIARNQHVFFLITDQHQVSLRQ